MKFGMARACPCGVGEGIKIPPPNERKAFSMLTSENAARQSLNVLPFLPTSRCNVALPAPLPTAAEKSEPAQPSLLLSPAVRSAEPPLSPAEALAHDARNLLLSIELIAGILNQPSLVVNDLTQYAGQLTGAVQALSGLVTQLAASSVPSVQAPVPARRKKTGTTPAGDALTQCGPLLRATAGPRVQVYLSAERDLTPLALDDESLRRTLVNLVGNAAEAMGERGGIVRITARKALSRTSPAVLLHIVDDGPGIPEHALGSIFQRGWSSKGSGRGLGLAIVRELVDDVGGEVRVASRRRHGTTFELRIPCSVV